MENGTGGQAQEARLQARDFLNGGDRQAVRSEGPYITRAGL